MAGRGFDRGVAPGRESAEYPHPVETRGARMASWLSNVAFMATIPAAIGAIAFWLEVATAKPAAAGAGSDAPPINGLGAQADQAHLNAVLRHQAEYSSHAAFWTAVTLFLQTLSTALKFITLNAPPPPGFGL
jgi:hypothetical protein